MASKKDALLSSEGGEAQIPEFCTTLTCTALLINGLEEHLQLPEATIHRIIAGEEFMIALKPVYDVNRQAAISRYHFLRTSTIYRLYVHEEMKEEVENG
jgi:hypothetical protein